MKIFNSIKEFIEYIPNCLVCNKSMDLAVQGMNWNYSRIHLKMNIDEGVIISKNKEYPLVISIENNKLISGEHLIKSLSNRLIRLNKSCRTCNFKIQSAHDYNTSYNTGLFPSVKLEHEELHYTRTHGKNVDIVRHFWGNKPSTSILIDHKSIKSFDLDLSKFKDLEHLNNRLSVLVTFQ